MAIPDSLSLANAGTDLFDTRLRHGTHGYVGNALLALMREGAGLGVLS